MVVLENGDGGSCRSIGTGSGEIDGDSAGAGIVGCDGSESVEVTKKGEGVISGVCKEV